MGMVFRLRRWTKCLTFVLGAQASPPARCRLKRSTASRNPTNCPSYLFTGEDDSKAIGMRPGRRGRLRSQQRSSAWWSSLVTKG
jgi:hypothetical protein